MKKGILFVGSFMKESQTGHVGGQMFACNSLLSSNIHDQFNWYLVDSTAPSAISSSFIKRTWSALKRIFQCLKFLIFEGKNIHTALIFTVDGFSFLEKGMILLMAKLFGKKTILAPRSGLFPNNFKNSLFKQFIHLVFKNSDWIICQGTTWKDFFLKEFDNLNSEKYIIINNWIDPKLYENRIKLEQTSKIIITYIGWFEDFKGIEDLLDVIVKVNSNPLIAKKVEFRLAGMGSKFNDISEQLEKLAYQNVKLLGWVKGESKESLLKETDIYIQLSHVEGFPNAILEAMASGKAVICTNAGAISDLIENGHNGIIVEIRNTLEAYQKLALLIQDEELRCAIAKKANQSVNENFVLERALGKFNKILN